MSSSHTSSPSAGMGAGPRGPRPAGGPRGDRKGSRFAKVRRFCKYCKEKVAHIDYKNADLLRASIPERAKIQPRRLSGACARHQRQLTVAIKRARHLALIPFQSD